MRITTFPTYTDVNDSEFYGKTAIVIDLLRATSTICTALHNGCARVIPVEEVEEAKKITAELRMQTSAACGGERDGAKLPGFDYGNSPFEYNESAMSGKVLVLCTTNGTQAIHKATAASAIYTGCLNNAKAVAIKTVIEKRDVVLLCAGTRCKFSVDDVVAAGAIIHRICKLEQINDADMDDLSHTALWLYKNNRQDLHPLLHVSRPYRTLVDLGQKKDIDYCLQEDIMDDVPCVEVDTDG